MLYLFRCKKTEQELELEKQLNELNDDLYNCFETENYFAAVDIGKQILILDNGKKTNPGFVRIMAAALFNSQQYEEAIEYYTSYIELEKINSPQSNIPSHDASIIFSKRATAYKYIGDRNKALSDYKSAVKILERVSITENLLRFPINTLLVMIILLIASLVVDYDARPFLSSNAKLFLLYQKLDMDITMCKLIGERCQSVLVKGIAFIHLLLPIIPRILLVMSCALLPELKNTWALESNIYKEYCLLLKQDEDGIVTTAEINEAIEKYKACNPYGFFKSRRDIMIEKITDLLGYIPRN